MSGGALHYLDFCIKVVQHCTLRVVSRYKTLLRGVHMWVIDSMHVPHNHKQSADLPNHQTTILDKSRGYHSGLLSQPWDQKMRSMVIPPRRWADPGVVTEELNSCTG